MTSHYLYATLQTHLTNVNGNGQILFSMHHYRHIWTRPFLRRREEEEGGRGERRRAEEEERRMMLEGGGGG